MTVDDLASVLGTISNSLPPGYGLGEVECRMLAEHLLAGYRVEPVGKPLGSHAVLCEQVAELRAGLSQALLSLDCSLSYLASCNDFPAAELRTTLNDAIANVKQLLGKKGS